MKKSTTRQKWNPRNQAAFVFYGGVVELAKYPTKLVVDLSIQLKKKQIFLFGLI